MSTFPEHDILSILNQLRNLASHQQVPRHSSSMVFLHSVPQNTRTPEQQQVHALAAALDRYYLPNVDEPEAGHHHTTATGRSEPMVLSFAAGLAGRQMSSANSDLLQRTNGVSRQPQLCPQQLPLHVFGNSSALAAAVAAASCREAPVVAGGRSGGDELHGLLSQLTGRGNEFSQSSHIPNLNNQSHAWTNTVLGHLSLPVAEQTDAGDTSIIRLPSAPIFANADGPGVILGTSPRIPFGADVQTLQAVSPKGAGSNYNAVFGRSLVNHAGFNQLQLAVAATVPSNQTSGPLLRNLNGGNPGASAQSAVIDSRSGQPVSRNKRKYPHANFAQKLHQIVTALEEEGKDDIVTFMDEGGVWVRDKVTFVNEIMPMYCRGQGWSSFRRQLFSYRFSALPRSKGKNGAYANSLFLRGRPDLCEKIIRDAKHDKINRRLRNCQPDT
ncbi:hypothetical protein ACA910_019415 [Epithemia clementina (nom. ined.)]